MSRAKAKQIRDLAQIPRSERYDALQHETALHRDAFHFKMIVYNGLWLKANPQTVRSDLKKWIKYHHDKAIELFTKRFLEAYHNKSGRFFRALADVLEGENPNWSNRERFIFAQCEIATNMKEPLPSASQFLRAWRIHCGMVPERADDLAVLWQFLFGNKQIPKSRVAVTLALRPFLGAANPIAADVQIVQIQREARNMGFILPRQSRRDCLPAGFQLTP